MLDLRFIQRLPEKSLLPVLHTLQKTKLHQFGFLFNENNVITEESNLDSISTQINRDCFGFRNAVFHRSIGSIS